MPRRLRDRVGRLVDRVARSVVDVVGTVANVLLRRPATPADAPQPESDVRPRWGVLAVSLVAAGTLLAFRLGIDTALYWYAFPLFGIGVTYVIQFRSEMSGRWWAVMGGSGVLSAVALAMDWAFSGHILWNVLFIGHAAQTPPRRTWTLVLLASLAELLVLKLAFQRPKDAVGAVVSLAVAMVALPLAGPRRSVPAAV